MNDEEIEAEIEADAELQRELAEIDAKYENDMLSYDQEDEAAALGEILQDGEEEDDAEDAPGVPEGDEAAKPKKQRISFEEEDEPTKGGEEEELLEPDEFPEDRQAQEELGTDEYDEQPDERR